MKQRFPPLPKEADMKSGLMCSHHSLAQMLIMYKNRMENSYICLLNKDDNTLWGTDIQQVQYPRYFIVYPQTDSSSVQAFIFLQLRPTK